MTADSELAAALRDELLAEQADLRRLHDRLATRAAVEGILDAAYRTVETPVGPLLLASTNKGLARVAYASEDHDRVLDDLARRIGARILRHPAQLDDAARQLDEYFSGRRRTFELPLDCGLTSGYRRDVLHLLPTITYGHTASYAAVAKMTGRPSAARAVGTACATNPIPVVVPCHRIVRADGGIGGYLGGIEAKATLLTLERAE
jgi:methylated-DNA-[protein]-cysteine S-methyltransferase